MPEQNVQVTQALNDPLEREMAAALTAAGIAFLTGDGGENPSGLDFLLPNGVEIEVKQFHSPRIADQMARAANVIAVQGRSALAWLCGLLTERGQMIRELRETTDVLARHRTRAEPDLVEVLRKCRDQFEFYVNAHMAKQPPDMDKAATNQEFVELCDDALSRSEEGV